MTSSKRSCLKTVSLGLTVDMSHSLALLKNDCVCVSSFRALCSFSTCPLSACRPASVPEPALCARVTQIPQPEYSCQEEQECGHPLAGRRGGIPSPDSLSNVIVSLQLCTCPSILYCVPAKLTELQNTHVSHFIKSMELTFTTD